LVCVSEFSTGLDARAHAAFFRELALNRVFHPQTRFILSSDDRGGSAVVSIMPRLAQVPDGVSTPRPASVVQKILGQAVASHWDVASDRNYGLGDDGKVYYSDLHVLSKTPSSEVMAWYCKRVNEKRASMGMPVLGR